MLLYRGASDLYIPHDSSSGDFDNDGVNECCFSYWIATPNAGIVENNMFIANYNGFFGSDAQGRRLY